MRALIVLIGVGALASCTIGQPLGNGPPVTTGEGEGSAGEGEGEGAPAATACAVLQSRCIACHDGGSFQPDLTEAAVRSGALVGVHSSTFPSEIYVVAGDPASSFVFKKVSGNAANEGSPMPLAPNPALTSAEKTLISDWIGAGAPSTDCDGVTPPPTNPAVVESAPPNRYGTAPPSGDYSGAPCSSGQYWTGGNGESDNMRPGDDCRGCHVSTGDGPVVDIMGTVFSSLQDGTNCRGLAPSNYQVLIDIMNEAGAVQFTLSANNAGNFYSDTEQAPNPFRAQVRLVDLTGVTVVTQTMQTPQTVGSCNTCHTESANGPTANDIPLGRIIIAP